MQIFSEFISFMTVRIEAATGPRVASGTGFFHHFCEKDDSQVPVIVTNRHVLQGRDSAVVYIHSQTAERKPDFGNHVRVEISDLQKTVIYHPDSAIDLAILLAAPILKAVEAVNRVPFYSCSRQYNIARGDLLEHITLVEPILMVGYPNGLWDHINNLPLIRDGITATPYKTDFQGRKEFMIDCACFPGSSGSPVFLNQQGTIFDRKNNSVSFGSRHSLLGILYAGPQFTAEGDIVLRTIPTENVPISVTRIPNNLGYCLKACLLDDFESHLLRLGV